MNIKVLSFDREKFIVNFSYLGDSRQDVLVSIKWMGSTLFFTDFTLDPNPSVIYFAHPGKTYDFMHILEVVFQGNGWEENFFFSGKKSPSIDYKKLPRVYHPPRCEDYIVYEEIFVSKLYENDLAPVERGDIVVDIGANNGFFVLYAKEKNPQKIIAYEPTNLTFPFLKKNTEGIDHIFLHQKALGGKTGTSIILESLGDSAGSRLVTPEVRERLSSHNSYEIEVITLEEVFIQNNLTKIDYLKIDCEGSELEILDSLPVERFKRINKIFVETHDSYLSEGVKKILEDNDFEYEVREHSGGCQIYYARNKNLNSHNL